MNFKELNEKIRPLDEQALADSHAQWNRIAKPVGSLGRLETMITRIAGISGEALPSINKRAVLIMCADNGVLAQGVAQTPGEITATMSEFMAARRSSVCIMARACGTESIPIDVGIARKLTVEGIRDCHVADGTADMTEGPAMTVSEAEQAIQHGIELVRELKEEGFKLLATGEMGIGNTTTSSAIASVLLGMTPEVTTGRGAGLSNEGLDRKLSAIKRAIAVNAPDAGDAFDVLRKLGGLDIAALCGVFLGGALYRVPIIIDGFISAVAALVATRLCPRARDFMLPSHVSAEPASRLVLDELEFSAIIQADMRLGEGTGAVAIIPLLDLGLAVYKDLMTFADIGMA